MEFNFQNFKWSYNDIELMGFLFDKKIINGVEMICLIPCDAKDKNGLNIRSVYQDFEDWNNPECRRLMDSANKLIKEIFGRIYGHEATTIWIERTLLTEVTDEQWSRRPIEYSNLDSKPRIHSFFN